MESLILDCLCLDSDKGLIKVPLVALQQLEISPHALNTVTEQHPFSAGRPNEKGNHTSRDNKLKYPNL